MAIKVLPEHLALNAELRERFQREAETIANLKHPNICVLYDIGEAEIESADVAPASGRHTEPPGRRRYHAQFLVMEYLEGETLAQRLQSRARQQADTPGLPLDQVLRYAIEISDALDKAHRKGATHRDIKPGNIMLTKEGSKLLDFGLAKLRENAKLKQQARKPVALGPDDPTPPLGSPLLGSAAESSPPVGKPTIEGTILGTVQYMSPEQVEGRIDDIDGRSDIFSFGATLYEMLTGRKCFEGKSPASIMAKILEVNPPPVSQVQSEALAQRHSARSPSEHLSPPALDRVVKRCLEKDRADRWQSAADLTEALKWIRDGTVPASAAVTPTAVAEPKPAVPVWRRALPWAVTAILSVAVGVAAWMLKPAPPQPVSRVAITLPSGQRLASLDQPAIAISPDGRNLVYVAIQSRPLPLRGGEVPDREGAVAPPPGTQPLADARGSDAVQQLYLRPLDSNESKPIAGDRRRRYFRIILVARQPVHRIRVRRQAEDHSCLRRAGTSSCRRLSARGSVEPGWNDSLYNRPVRKPVAHSGHGRGSITRDEAGTFTRREDPSLAAVSSGWPAFSL